MNRNEFLNILYEGLKDFPESELNDILYDYKEHFDVGAESGKSEDEIINELGNPYEIVNQYRNGYLDSKVKSNNSSKDNFNSANYTNSKKTSSSVNTILTIIAVTLSLILFGPIVGSIVSAIAAILISVIAASGGIAIAGIGILIGKVVTNTIGLFTFPSFILDFPDKVIVLIVIGCILLLIFTVLLFYYYIKAFIVFMKTFLRWVGPKLRGEA